MQSITIDASEEEIERLTHLQLRLTHELEHQHAAKPQTIAALSVASSDVLTRQAGFMSATKASLEEETTLSIVHPLVTIRNLPWVLATSNFPQLTLVKAHLPELPTFKSTRGYPLKILVMVSGPEGTSNLNFEEEEAQLLQAFHPLMEEGMVAIHFTDDGSLEDLDRKLQENHYHIFHYSGHGVYEQGQGFLILEDALTAGPRKTAAEEINAVLEKARLQGHAPELVVLSACQTAQAQASGETGGVADTLLKGGQTAVIAMSASILDNCATLFSTALYRNLAQGLPLPYAFRLATEALRQFEYDHFESSGKVPSQWLIPQLFMGKDLTLLADPDKPTEKLNFKAEAKFITGEKDLLYLRHRPDQYMFIGRRRDRRAVFQQLRAGQSILLRGQGGVGKTAFAEHLAIRLMAYSQRYKPFVLSERDPNEHELLNKIIDYLVGNHQCVGIELELQQMTKLEDKLAYLLPLLGQYCEPVFIFDNIEAYQELHTNAWKITYGGILNMILFIHQQTAYSMILTGRYLVPEIPDLLVHDLNTVSFPEFLKKCWQLSLSGLAGEPAVNKAGTIKTKPVKGFLEVVRQLYAAFGGNYRALEFFDELYKELGQEQALMKLDELLATVQGEMKINLVLQELLALLSAEELDVLQLLAQFNIPVYAKAISLQRGEKPMEEMLNRVTNLTLAERSEYGGHLWFYATPLVKELLQDLKLPQVVFSDKLAGDYHAHVLEQEIHNDLVEAIEAFGFYEKAKDPQGVNSIGLSLCNFYFATEQVIQQRSFGLRIKAICGDLTDPRINNYLGIAYRVLGEVAKGLPYLEQALAGYLHQEDMSGVGVTLNNLATAYISIGQYDKAFNYLEQALPIVERTTDESTKAKIFDHLAILARHQGDFDKALKFAEMALIIKQNKGDKAGEATTLNSIGEIHLTRGDLDRSLEYFNKSLTLHSESGSKRGEASVLNNISSIYHDLKKYEEALGMLEKSLKIRQEINDHQGTAIVLHNISQIFQVKGQDDKALDYLQKALVVFQDIKDPIGEATTLGNIGMLHANRKEFNNALRYYERALNIRKSIGDQHGIGNSLHNIASLYFRQQDVDAALPRFLEAYQIFQEIGAQSDMDRTDKFLQAIRKEIGERAYYLRVRIIKHKKGWL